jgi:acyl-CoA hydrolase
MRLTENIVRRRFSLCHDQANASCVDGKIYSGIGGSADFIVGALHSRGGKAFVAMLFVKS